jgi:MoxR-like ATPase
MTDLTTAAPAPVAAAPAPVSAVPVVIVDERVSCAECGFKSHSLLDHLVEVHATTPAAYLAAHPDAATVSDKALRAFELKGTGVSRRAAPVAGSLTNKLMGMEMAVDAGIPEEKCLPLPPGYVFPTKGKAHSVFKRALMALERGRNAFIWGMPGTGKDALVHAFSAFTRRPVVMVTFRPGTDLAPWFYTRSIDSAGTGWEYGHLWHAVVNGIEGRDGKRRAALVLLSDVDRADSAQAEWFRILTDSISGRILGPTGDMIPLFPGTQFVCTANSCGTGDARGRMASANPMDASIMDRLGRKIEAAYMHWDDESGILRGKYPKVAELAPELFPQLGNATDALRKAIDSESIYAEFTHRGLCEVLAEADDILHYSRGVPANLLKKAFHAWLDGLDADSRFEAKRIIDGHITGGAVSDDEDE